MPRIGGRAVSARAAGSLKKFADKGAIGIVREDARLIIGEIDALAGSEPLCVGLSIALKTEAAAGSEDRRRTPATYDVTDKPLLALSDRRLVNDE